MSPVLIDNLRHSAVQRGEGAARPCDPYHEVVILADRARGRSAGRWWAALPLEWLASPGSH
jgi:hypothetical protein